MYFVVFLGEFVVCLVMLKVRYFIFFFLDVDDCVVVIWKVDDFIVVGLDVEGGVDFIWVLYFFYNEFKIY